MKKQLMLVLGVVAVMSASSLYAQEKSLVGIWRMYSMMDRSALRLDTETNQMHLDSTKLKPGSFLKMITGDKKFTNLFVSNTLVCISGYGTYDIRSEFEYVEHVETSYTNPKHSSSDNVLFYQFANEDYLVLTYGTDNGGRIFEVWKRVEGANPFLLMSK
jgi:hypothetical protein